MPSVGEITTCCDDNRHITDHHAPKCQIDSLVGVITNESGGRDDTDVSDGEYGYRGTTGGRWSWSNYIIRWERTSDCSLRIEWVNYDASCQFFDLGLFDDDGCDPYGNFSSTQTQEASFSGDLITFNNIKYSRGIYLSSSSRIKVHEPGLYRFGFSCQLNNNSRTHGKIYAGTAVPFTVNAPEGNTSYYYYYNYLYGWVNNLYNWLVGVFSGTISITIRGKTLPRGKFWIRKNGVNIANTERVVGNELTTVCEYYVQLEKDDYIEVMFAKCQYYDYSNTYTFDPEIDKFSIVNTLPTSLSTTESMHSIILNAHRITNYLPETVT